MDLIKGMFGTEFNPSRINFAGLCCGQMRGGSTKIGHNSGWYNKAGEKLGFGDLNAEDVRKIQDNLEPGQFFVVLSEHDSFWNFVRAYGPIGAMCVRDEKEEAPGQEYIAERFMYAVSKDMIYVHESRSIQGYLDLFKRKVEGISEDRLLTLLKAEELPKKPPSPKERG